MTLTNRRVDSGVVFCRSLKRLSYKPSGSIVTPVAHFCPSRKNMANEEPSEHEDDSEQDDEETVKLREELAKKEAEKERVRAEKKARKLAEEKRREEEKREREEQERRRVAEEKKREVEKRRREAEEKRREAEAKKKEKKRQGDQEWANRETESRAKKKASRGAASRRSETAEGNGSQAGERPEECYSCKKKGAVCEWDGKNKACKTCADSHTRCSWWGDGQGVTRKRKKDETGEQGSGDETVPGPSKKKAKGKATVRSEDRVFGTSPYTPYETAMLQAANRLVSHVAGIGDSIERQVGAMRGMAAEFERFTDGIGRFLGDVYQNGYGGYADGGYGGRGYENGEGGSGSYRNGGGENREDEGEGPEKGPEKEPENGAEGGSGSTDESQTQK